ncbi:MAG TPA: aldo/keto reductase [Candidatus Polarisedimenticolaceae bacterium]|nr:aldo/keto reductase [Candidatus Polarisedimenticolaceae bacterium]
MINRREILRMGALAGFGLALGRRAFSKEALRTKPIPSTGERLPVIGLGTNQYGVHSPEERVPLREVLRRMPELGGKVIDTAPAYGRSEEVLGDLLAELGNRDRYFLATKVTAPEGSAERGKAMLEESLRRLKTGRLDLVQVHNLDGVDVLLPVLRAWKESGKIRYLGITTSRPEAHTRLTEFMSKYPLDFIQVDYSLGNRAAAERVLPLAQERRMAVLVNLPLGGRRGSLLAKVSNRPLPPWAAELEARSWAQLFLKYCVSHPAVTCAIPGTTKVRHLEDNLAAARGPLPDPATRKRMEEFWDALG